MPMKTSTNAPAKGAKGAKETKESKEDRKKAAGEKPW